MKGLNLTDDQKAAMKKIHESTKAQLEAVNKDESLTAEQKEAKPSAAARRSHADGEAPDARTAATDESECSCVARIPSRTTAATAATNPTPRLMSRTLERSNS